MNAIAAGYRRGFAAIIDANVVTFMTAFILFIALPAGRAGLRPHARHRRAGLAVHGGRGDAGDPRHDGPHARDPRPSRARACASSGASWTFDFMGNSRWFFTLSGTILLIGAIAIGGRGLNFGIDFVVAAPRSRSRSCSSPSDRSEVASLLARRQNVRAASSVQAITKTRASSAATASRSRPRRCIAQQLGRRRQRRCSKRKFGVKTGDFNSTSVGPSFGKTVANSGA